MSIFSSIGEMWYRWGREVAIFWDHENCPIPSGEGAGFFVKRIYDAASRYGTVKSFKAYDNAQSVKTLSNLGKALGMYKGEVISCPGDGKRNVADRAILVDIPTYLLDVGDLKAKLTTIILITSDGDYLRVVQKLRERNVEVIVILPHQRNRQLRELGSKSLVWENVSGLAADGYRWAREVAIFWDYENCRIPAGERHEDVVARLYNTATRYGAVKSFKAYDEPQQGSTERLLKQAMTKYQGEVICCPHQGKADVVDKAIIGGIPMHLLDIGDRAKKTTIVLISGDADFTRVVEQLRQQGFEVIVICHSRQGSDELRRVASSSLSWEDVTGVRLTAQKHGSVSVDDSQVSLEDISKCGRLVEYLRTFGDAQVPRPQVGEFLSEQKKMNPDFYLAVGCEGFQEYIKYAVALGVIIASPTKGTGGEVPWISLRPSLREILARQPL